MPARRNDVDAAIHSRLINWATCHAGGLPSIETTFGHPTQGTSDEDDAALIEAALNVIRYRRPPMYRLVRRVYLHKATTLELCRDFRCSESRVKEMKRALHAGLDLMLAAYESRARQLKIDAIDVVWHDLRIQADLTKGAHPVYKTPQTAKQCR